MSPIEPHGTEVSVDDASANELESLRARVAAQDRLIDSFIDESADVHALRQRNHDLEQYVGRVLAVPGVRSALKVRRRLLGRGD